MFSKDRLAADDDEFVLASDLFTRPQDVFQLGPVHFGDIDGGFPSARPVASGWRKGCFGEGVFPLRSDLPELRKRGQCH